jgi:hypothetical protein
MILFSMVDDDIIDPLDACLDKVADIFKFFGRVNGIDKGGLLTPPDQVGIVAGPFRERNQGIKKPAVPIDSTDPEDIRKDFSYCHGG